MEGQAATGKKTDQVRPAWADGTLKAAGVWRAVEAANGLRQGDPPSCILAAVGMARLMKAAKQAMNETNGVPALEVNAPHEERLQHWKQASAKGSVKAYLDDGALTSKMRAVVAPIRRNH